MLARARTAWVRCRLYILSIFVTYVLSSAAGIFMAHSGHPYALAERDRIVRNAVTSDRTSIAYGAGDRVTAMTLDFAGNLFLAAIPQALGGLAIVPPYFSVAYQGWIGGIVSVDGAHRSRLRSARTAAYYLLVLVLQFIPFSLTIGAGVRAGVQLYRHNAQTGWRFWRYRLPRETLVDVACLFAIAIPLFLLASAFEFLSPWNVAVSPQ